MESFRVANICLISPSEYHDLPYGCSIRVVCGTVIELPS